MAGPVWKEGSLGSYRGVRIGVEWYVTTNVTTVDVRVVATFQSQSNVQYTCSTQCLLWDSRTQGTTTAAYGETYVDHRASDWGTIRTSTYTFSLPRPQSGSYSINAGARGNIWPNGVNLGDVWGDGISIYAIDQPRSPDGVTNTRDSDNKNTVTWSYSGTTNPLAQVFVERSVDGGTYAVVANLAAGTTSCVDTTTQPNHSYTYRIRTEWYGNWSAYAYANVTTYNTPAAPGKPSVSRVDTNTVRLSFSNPGLTQLQTDAQRSTDGTNWVNISSVTGSAVAAMTDNPGGGIFYYQVRNSRGALVSAWSPVSEAIVTITPPAVPTLLTPGNAGVVKKSDTELMFTWKHNPIDGSTQTTAELRYSTNNGSSWTTQTISGDSQFLEIANSFTVNASVIWQVRTKGVHADWGPWASLYSFRVCQIPQVVITSPGSTLPNMPLSVKWDYSDQSGTQTSATVILLNDSGVEVYREALSGSTNTITITSAEFLPENLKSYLLRLEVRSSSSLTAATEIALRVDYIPPAIPVGQIEVNEDIGAVSILAFSGEVDGIDLDEEPCPETISVGIYRKHADGRIVTLISEAPSGTGFYDAYPPLDQDFEYLIVAYTDTGVTSRLEIPINIPSYGAAFFNFGKDFCSTALVALDTECNKTLEHHSEMYQTAAVNNPYPLIFYGPSDDLQGTVSGTALRDPKMLNISSASSAGSIDTLSQYRDIVIMRLPYEQALPVDITVSQSFANDGMLSNISINWVRVRANGLAI